MYDVCLHHVTERANDKRKTWMGWGDSGGGANACPHFFALWHGSKLWCRRGDALGDLNLDPSYSFDDKLTIGAISAQASCSFKVWTFKCPKIHEISETVEILVQWMYEPSFSRYHRKPQVVTLSRYVDEVYDWLQRHLAWQVQDTQTHKDRDRERERERERETTIDQSINQSKYVHTQCSAVTSSVHRYATPSYTTMYNMPSW